MKKIHFIFLMLIAFLIFPMTAHATNYTVRVQNSLGVPMSYANERNREWAVSTSDPSSGFYFGSNTDAQGNVVRHTADGSGNDTFWLIGDNISQSCVGQGTSDGSPVSSIQRPAFSLVGMQEGGVYTITISALSYNLPDASVNSEEETFVYLVNQLRAQNGLAALQIDSRLSLAANSQSHYQDGLPDAANNGTHCGPALSADHPQVSTVPVDRIADIAPTSTYDGEIIHWGNNDNAQQSFDSLNSSPEHRAVMLSSSATCIGVGMTVNHLTADFSHNNCGDLGAGAYTEEPGSANDVPEPADTAVAGASSAPDNYATHFVGHRATIVRVKLAHPRCKTKQAYCHYNFYVKVTAELWDSQGMGVSRAKVALRRVDGHNHTALWGNLTADRFGKVSAMVHVNVPKTASNASGWIRLHLANKVTLTYAGNAAHSTSTHTVKVAG